MREPSVRSSRLAIAGGLLAVILVGGAGFMLGRSTTARDASPVAVSPPPVAPAPAPEPRKVTQVVGRAAMIDLARGAADALASGNKPADTGAELVGRRFDLALPFGCAGAAGADSTAPLRWRYDDKSRTLRIQITETMWQPEAWGLPESGAPSRGFWISHPWTASDNCPVAPANPPVPSAGAVVLPGQTLAVASFDAEPSRQPTPLEAAVKLEQGRAPPDHGLRARITGHIDHVPGGGGSIICAQPAGIEQQPVCAVAVIFDELKVEDPDSGETLATWTLG